MKVLVTGGAGYIGSHVVDLMVNQRYEVVVFDNLSTGHREAIHPQAVFIYGDLLDQSKVRETFAAYHFDGILHFASNTLVGESMEEPWLYLRDNVLGASYLLEAAVENKVGKLILSSTSNLFNDPKRIPIAENDRIIPGSPYGESKAMIERFLYWMARLYGLTYGCLRYFNAAGAHLEGHLGEDHTPETHLIPSVLQVALGQRDGINIFGDDYNTIDGTCIRDYVHVMDLATAHVLAFEALQKGTSFQYNLGSGSGSSVKQIIEVARQVTEHPIPYTINTRRPGDPACLVSDSTTIQEQLGWKPQYSDIQTIIQSAWEWHRKHPEGYTSQQFKYDNDTLLNN